MKTKKVRNLPPVSKKLLGVLFKSAKWKDSAMSHPSYRHERPPMALEDFDRLEFFGDSILNFVICKKIFAQFPGENEGMLSRLRSILVSRKILFRIVKESGLIPSIRLGKSLQKVPMAHKTKIFADVFESLIAAVYFDRGFAAAEKFILRYYRTYFDAKRLFRLDPNPKSTLQELCQKQWQKIPIYQTEMTPRGLKTVVTIGARRKAAAIGRTRQDGEEKAARLLIRKIRQEALSRSKKTSSGRKFRKIL